MASAESAAIVRSIIGMAHNLGLAVVAEGVETQDQADFLLGLTCEEAQGFLYAKPLAAEELARLLAAARLGDPETRVAPRRERSRRRAQ